MLKIKELQKTKEELFESLEMFYKVFYLEKTAMIFDTHAHYDDEQFDADREELFSGMKAGGVGMIVDAAAAVASWDKILELTEKYPFLYGSVGGSSGRSG